MSTSPLRTLAIRLLAAAAVLLAGTTPASAQLKNTPWPTFQHDKEHSGRSGQLGPLFPSGAPGPGAVKTLQVGDKIKSQPVIDSDGTIYVGSGWSFCAIHPAANTASGEMEMYPSTSLHGRAAWCTRLGADNSAGASGSIDMRSYVYFVDRDNAMNAFDPDGNIVCRYRHGQEGDIKTTVGVNPVNGRLYFAPLQNFWGPGPLIATPPAPNCDFEDELWHYQNPTGSYISTSHPAFAVENGQHMIYIADTLGYLHKYRDDGNSATHLWQVKPGGGKISAAPTIGAGGSVIYIGSSAGFHAVNTSGGVIWTYPTLGWADQAAALGLDGTIYVGSKSGKSKRLYAINPTGSLKWEFGPIHSDADIGTFPIVAADGVVYGPIGTKVYAFDPTTAPFCGAISSTGTRSTTPRSAATRRRGQSGTAILYVATGSAGTLYAISSARTGSGQNDPPVACISVNSGAAHCNPGSTESAAIGETVTFSGASSQDTDPLTYAWNFGDGSTGTGQVVTHTYWSAGNRTVTLTVSDGLASDTNTVTMSVGSGGGGSPVSDNFNRGDNTTIGNGWRGGAGVGLRHLGQRAEKRGGQDHAYRYPTRAHRIHLDGSGEFRVRQQQLGPAARHHSPLPGTR